MAGAFLLREVGEKVGDGAVERGVLEVGGNFGEGGEDEAALVEGGVGEGEVWGLEDLVGAVLVGVEEEIEVEDAGTFGWGV